MKREFQQENREFGEAQMLEMAKIADAFTELLGEPYLSIEQIEEITGKIFTDMDVVDAWLNICRELKAAGTEPSDEVGLMDEFKIIAWKQWSIFKENPPPLSVVGSMHFSNQNHRENRIWIVDEIFTVGLEAGCTGYIYGVPGSGKTNFAVAEIYRPLIDTDAEIDLNIPVRNIADNAKFNTTLSGTLLHGAQFAAQSLAAGKMDYLVVWLNDEAQVARDRQRAGADRNIWMKQATLLGRKLGFAQLSILQQNKPPSEVAEFATHIYRKPLRSRKDCVDLNINGPYTISMKLRGIQSAEERGIEYQSRSMYVYEVDLNPLRMLDYISTLTSREGMLDETRQFDDIITYIKKHRGERLDIISDDVVASLLYRARKRLVDSPNAFEKRMASYHSLGLLVGWNEKKVERWIKKIDEHIRDGKMEVPEDTDDFLVALSGAVEPPEPIDGEKNI